MSKPLTPDPRPDEAYGMSIKSAIQKLGIQNLQDNGEWLCGPCFECGGDDRLQINTRDKGYFCRKRCGVKGLGAIDLTKQFLRIDYKAALEYLCGERPKDIDPEVVKQRREQRKKEDQRLERDRNRYRQNAINFAIKIWNEAVYTPRDENILRYFEARGIPRQKFDTLPKCLRFHPNLAYGKKINGDWVEFHSGPAMVSAVQMPNRKMRCVHRTWLDLDQENGKAVICHNGETHQSKTMLGSKKGGAIRLFTPDGADTLVMGEGIETTLTAWAARPFARAAYWAGADLGNMAGKMAQPRKRNGIPDLSDDRAFLPPPWVRRLVLIQDGDSDPEFTRAQLLSCIKRAMHHIPGLEGFIVHAGAGRDLNDILKTQAVGRDEMEAIEHDR